MEVKQPVLPELSRAEVMKVVLSLPEKLKAGDHIDQEDNCKMYHLNRLVLT